MQPYEAILFDFDGVLVDSEPVHYACWLEILQPFGISLEWADYCQRCIGISDRAMISLLCEQANPPLPFDRLWAEYPRKKELVRDRLISSRVLAEPVVDLIRNLRSEYLVGVVTSSGKREVEAVLEAAEVLPLLHTAVYGDDVVRHKPAPDPYLLAVERLGVSRALVIEDSRAGLEAARAAGLDVLHLPLQSELCDRVSRHLEVNRG